MLLVCAGQSAAAVPPLLLLLRMPHQLLNETAVVVFVSWPEPGLFLTLLVFMYSCLCILMRFAFTPPSHNMRQIVEGL